MPTSVVAGDVLAQIQKAEFERTYFEHVCLCCNENMGVQVSNVEILPYCFCAVKRRIGAIRMLAESDLGSMRATFEVNLGFIPDHIKNMSYKDYKSASPTTLENRDPNLRRQSSKLKPVESMPPPQATPAAGSRSKKNMEAAALLQTPMVRAEFCFMIYYCSVWFARSG